VDIVLRALGLPKSAVVEPAAGGASASAWKVRADGDQYVLRLSDSAEMTAARLSAMAAARGAGLPVPDLVRRASTGRDEVLLLSWLPGVPLADVLVQSPETARDLGHAMGALQRRLHEVTAPMDVPAVITDADHPFAAGRGIPGLPEGDALLHLDFHPLNLLVDPASLAISGIVDWDNARRGHPLLDLARTSSILTVEPSLASLPAELRNGLVPFREAWAEGYGAEARRIPAECHLWAGRVMLADLEARHAPEALEPLRRWTNSWMPG
jgi:aminoglycoside phosphotransferase (APT) family kinase protein